MTSDWMLHQIDQAKRGMKEWPEWLRKENCEISDDPVALAKRILSMENGTTKTNITELFLDARNVASALLASEAARADAEELRIVFDGPPSHECGRFVEVEDASGKSVKAGEWVKRDDGLWELRLVAIRARGAK